MEFDAFLRNFTKRLQRENLEAAGVSDDGFVPGHEAVQAAHFADQLVAGPEMEVIGVGEDHLGAHRGQIFRIERFDRSQCAHRHERWSFNLSMRRREKPGARGTQLRLNREGKAGHVR